LPPNGGGDCVEFVPPEVGVAEVGAIEVGFVVVGVVVGVVVVGAVVGVVAVPVGLVVVVGIVAVGVAVGVVVVLVELTITSWASRSPLRMAPSTKIVSPLARDLEPSHIVVPVVEPETFLNSVSPLSTHTSTVPFADCRTRK